MANPALSEKVFTRIQDVADTSEMTIEGTVNKTGFLLLFLIAGSLVGWNSQSGLLLIGSLIASLILCLLIVFKPARAPYLSQSYAFCEGILLGAISSMYAVHYPGIVTNALISTMGCLGIMLALYHFRIIRVTERFRSIVIIATMAVALTYLVNMILGFFSVHLARMDQSSPVGIGLSLGVVAIASLNLLLDFDIIERAKAQRAPKFMEWYCGFALVVTLVWLYMEILRLLSRLNRR